jgi:hypothetical protein
MPIKKLEPKNCANFEFFRFCTFFRGFLLLTFVRGISESRPYCTELHLMRDKELVLSRIPTPQNKVEQDRVIRLPIFMMATPLTLADFQRSKSNHLVLAALSFSLPLTPARSSAVIKVELVWSQIHPIIKVHSTPKKLFSNRLVPAINERVRCGSDSSAPACCTADPSTNLGSAPRRRPSTERKAMRTIRVVLYE